MTNGEKLKEIFPDGVLTSINNSYYWGDDILVSKNWWNAEYKEPNKSEIPTGSIIDWNNCHTSEQLDNIATTKNNLAVDAVSREAVNELVSSQRLDTFSDEGRKWANIKIDVILRGLKEMPSVTPQEPFINKPCVSSGVCEHDKNKVLDKIKAEIEKYITPKNSVQYDYEAKWQNAGLRMALEIIDKYKAEIEDKE